LLKRLVGLGAAVMTVVLGARVPARWAQAQPRETVLDRKVHVEPDILPVPQAPPLCDSLKLEPRQVDVGGCRLYCETEGAGQPLVLINGGPGGTHHDFHPDFGRAAEFAEVIYYDQRGCGRSDYARGSGYTVAQAVDDLDQLRAALKVERWVVLGWSYGGVLARSYLLKHPERVAGLVLVCSSPDALRLKLQPSRQSEFISAEEQKRIDEVYGKGGLPLAQMVFNAHLNGDWKRQGFYKPTTEQLARTALYGWKHDPAFRGSIGWDLSFLDQRGMFEQCPIPVLILEGKHDLTWGADKPAKLSACFPKARMVMFERSAHAPFMDEPEQFFSTLRMFLKGLPEKSPEVTQWKEQLAARQAARGKSPEQVLLASGWGRKSAARIAAQYSATWLAEVSHRQALLKLGFALYDTKRYEDALAVFRKMEQEQAMVGVARVWQGHLLDLLGRRADAIAKYQQASGLPLQTSHDQYGLVLSQEYVAQRIKTPFTRVENGSED
jgi:proline iminopeptidase